MPSSVSKKQDTPNAEKEQLTPICGCVQDPYVDLQPEVQQTERCC